MTFFGFGKPESGLKSKFREGLEFVVEIVKIIIISLAIIIPVRYFLVQPFYVKGASMEPSFENNEYLIINEIGYRLAPPIRGEVVVFHPPNDPTGEYYIKRIIGLPGETVEVKNGGVKIFNTAHPAGVVLDESAYLASDVQTYGDVTYQLNTDQYFVLGDNRPASLDSRRFGPITASSITGRVWVRGWPFDRITVFSVPMYNL